MTELTGLEHRRPFFPQKLSNMSITILTSMEGLQLLNLWLQRVILKCVDDGVTTIQPGCQTTGNAWYGRMSHPSRWSLHQEEFTFREHPPSPERLVPTVKQDTGTFCDGLGSNVVVFCWSHYYPPWRNYCKGVCGQSGWVIRFFLWSRLYIYQRYWCNYLVRTETDPFSEMLRFLVFGILDDGQSPIPSDSECYVLLWE
jgi:hypothetical protein